jgi:tetratricopeptide (TPR) repeat protein
LRYHILAGEIAAGRQLPDDAAKEFLQALEIQPDAKLAARTTALALSADDAAVALAAAHKWLEADPTSLDAREVITRVAVRQGHPDEAYDQCVAIISGHPAGQTDGFRYVALLLGQETEHQDIALGVMQRLVEKWPKSSGSHQAYALLALRFNKADLAEQQARAALSVDPQAKETGLLLTGALVKKGDLTGADSVMDTLLKDNPSATDLRLGYARLLIESNQREHARIQLTKLLAIKPNEPEAHLLLGLMALDDLKPDEAEPHFRKLLAVPDKAMDARYYLGRVYEMRKQPKQALAQYELVVSGNQALDAAVRRSQMLGQLGQVEKALTLLEALKEQYPPFSGRFTIAEGEVLSNSGRYQEALQLYNKALVEDPDDLDLLYSRALVLEDLSRLSDSEEDLRKILKKSPDDARTLNALGYMLGVHTTRLDEARSLVEQALKATPDDPAIVDSLGWITYRQGHADQALPLLRKAFQQYPDPEIAAHLGEVLWALGQKDKARTVWDQSLKSNPDNKILRETVNRLEK